MLSNQKAAFEGRLLESQGETDKAILCPTKADSTRINERLLGQMTAWRIIAMQNGRAEQPLLETKNLCKYFYTKSGVIGVRRTGVVKALDDVSLTLPRGRITALVGESGSGKTTLGRTILRIYSPTSGEIWFDGKDISHLDKKKLKEQRKKMAMVFQDPTSSLNPRRKVKQIVADPLEIHNLYSRSERLKRVSELLDLVGIPEDYMYKKPASLSEGESQRVGIARALALNPMLVVLDEPTSSVDVSVQAKIIELLKDLQTRLNLTYLLITHDMTVVRNLSHKLFVMYLGNIIEEASTNELFRNPKHPYTRFLLSSIPIIFEEELELLPSRIILKSEIPSPYDMPEGCRFHTRCPYKITGRCDSNKPEMIEVGKEHLVRCFLFK